jgi:hypothetical protein
MGQTAGRDAAKWAIESVWCAISRYCNDTTELSRLWSQLNEATEKNEKEHRNWMRAPSFKVHHPRACSVRLAAQYFAAMAPFREYEPPKSWLEAAQLRDDWLLGHALNEAFHAIRRKPNEPTYWELLTESDALKKPIEILKLVDYGSDLVR